MPAMVAQEVERVGEAPHFLVVTYPAQGHINPARHLALRLLRAAPGARVSFSTAVSACRKMFPEDNVDAAAMDHVDGTGVRYVPFSDGFDDGFDWSAHDSTDYMSNLKVVGARTLGGVLARLRDAGTPVTQVVYTVLLSWVAGVARGHGVPAAAYWIQPATVLASYFHFFRGTDGLDQAVAAAASDPWADVRVRGLPPMRVRDLPSFFTITSDDHPHAFVLTAFRELLDVLGREDMPTVLANTFDAMESDAVATLRQHGIDVVPIGPVLSFLGTSAASANNNNDLFKEDGKGYLDWLDAQEAGSVVYISFGSLSTMSKRQIAEVARGMAESGRPFLWVLRKDNRGEVDGDDLCTGGGMVVEWCDQGKVLSHPAVGCFVTHCGWNSTLESVACGVPIVGVPQWTDQGTNAWLVERKLATGVRAAVSEKDGVLEADELRRCIGFATSDVVRAKAALWREKARAAAAVGGLSERNLRAFVAGNR
ncbi:UDP-glycosyltransferase 75C1-like [Hordeum vulgare subsp. vulgare]|nr:UDP-glycosyltransferase 75C1-like [Hordeum vulgare subsp. vulgare]